MSKNLIIIVLYNKTPDESKTINSFIANNVFNKNNFKVVIWLNGNTNEDVIVKNATIISTKKNENLSYIYNTVIEKFPNFDTYTIFDDDSNVSSEYLDSIIHIKCDILVPEVFQNEQKLYPISLDSSRILNKDENTNLKTISSGLTISRSLIKKIKKKHSDIFDSRFSFYGVDFSFFYRLAQLNDPTLTIVQEGKIIHSLSRMEGGYKINSFRWQQKVFENILMRRNYPVYNSKLLFPKIILKCIFSFNVRFIIRALKVFIYNRSTM